VEDRTVPVTYFDEPGPQNTTATLDAALARARELDIEHIIVASDTGKTARQALERYAADRTVIVVTNPAGVEVPVTKLHDYLPRFREHKEQLIAAGRLSILASLSDEVVAELEQAGAVVLRLDWQQLQQFVRISLRAIDWVGVGVRVGLCISVWAHLAGKVPADAEVIAVAGTGFGGGGADTAIVVRTAERWLDWRVVEVVARPRLSSPTEQ
jgi:hypothetical protein